jgi:hypothetical protein
MKPILRPSDVWMAKREDHNTPKELQQRLLDLIEEKMESRRKLGQN